MKIILASASERRQDLMKRVVADFEVAVSDFNEELVPYENDVGEYVKSLAMGKARNVAAVSPKESLIIGCDTVVYFNGKVLGKPKSEEDAFSMLRLLSGKEHKVYSGIALIDNLSGKVHKDFICTDIVFSELTDEQIRKYIGTGEPMDKAGAYGIQGYGGIFVEKIHGCYYNVVGLPINKLYYMLKEMGVNL